MSRWAAPAPSCGPLLVHQLTTSTSWVVAGMEATAPPLLAQMSPAGQVTALLEDRRQGRAGQGRGSIWENRHGWMLLWACCGMVMQHSSFWLMLPGKISLFRLGGHRSSATGSYNLTLGQQIWIWFMDYCYCFLNMKATTGSPFQEFIIRPTAEWGPFKLSSGLLTCVFSAAEGKPFPS